LNNIYYYQLSQNYSRGWALSKDGIGLSFIIID
jgi:hypothetical protein